MLVTQNQSSTNWNSSFGDKKQENSRETFNLEFPTEIEIQSDIKTAKKIEVGGIEYPEFPSSNVAVNSAMNSAVSPATAVSSATAVSQTTATTATAYGYSVDSKGFMGADFNKAVGINENIKIHSKTIEQLSTHAKNIGFNGSAVEITKKAWSNFSQIIGDESALKGEKDIANLELPFSYTSDGSMLGEIRAIQRTYDEFLPLNNENINLYGLSVCGDDVVNSNFNGLRTPFSLYLDDDNKLKYIDILKDNYEIATDQKVDDFGISELFGVFVLREYQQNDKQSVALGDEYRASGKSLKDFIISKDAMDKLQEMVAQMHTQNSLFSTDELLNQVLMEII